MVNLPISVLPGATVLVQVGDKVTPGQPLARKEGSKEHNVPIAKLLSISPHKAAQTLVKQPGDGVVIGDTLAIRRNALGMTSAKLNSNINGIVTGFDEEKGMLHIADQHPADPYELVCPIVGVIQVCNNDQIVIQTDQNVIQGYTGAGATAQGVLHVLSDDQQVLLAINNTIIDKIIVGKSLVREAMIKAIGIGARGIIVTSVEDTDVQYLNEKNLLIPIIAVSEKDLPVLRKHGDQQVYIEGSTGTILLLK